MNNQQVDLANYLQSKMGEAFVWGETHCTALICGAMDAIRGTDFFNWHKETHEVTSKEKALEWCKTDEIFSLFDHLDLEEVTDNTWVTGDVVYTRSGDFDCCAIYLGGYLISSELNGVVQANDLFSYIKSINEYKVYRCQT